MMELIYLNYRRISDLFWNPDVWLPPNVTWKDIAPTEERKYADYNDLYKPIPFAFVIFFIRLIIERMVFMPWGMSLGLRASKPRTATPNPILEKAYSGCRSKPNLPRKQIQGLVKQLHLTEIQIERWFRIRHMQNRPSKLTKFSESAWRCLYYTFIAVYGFYCLWDKPWFWDIRHCYYDYPYHTVPDDIWWYYMAELTFYWSLTFSQFIDIKRKDFWEMFVHHITAVCLLGFSWTCNMTRIGTLVCCLHDSADVFLESAKMAKYANYQRLCDTLFTILTILWIITRLGLFPFYIIWSTSVLAPSMLPMFPAYYIFNGLLLILLLLHTIWTYFIIRIAYRAISAGTIQKDERSSSSECENSENVNGALLHKAGEVLNSNVVANGPARRRRSRQEESLMTN